MKNNIKKLSIKYYLRADKTTLIIVLIFGIIFNVGLVAIPLFEGLLAGRLYDILLGNKVFIDMLRLVAVYLVIMLIVQVSRFMKRYFVRRFANNTTQRLRNDLYNKILSKQRVELENTSLGELMTRAVSDIDVAVEAMRKTITEIFDTGVLLISYSITLFIFDWRLALISLCFTPLSWIVAEAMKRPIYKAVSSYKKTTEKLNNLTYDRVSGAMLYRVYGMERDRQIEYDKVLKEYEKKAIMANVWENTLQPIYNVLAMCGIVFIIIIGAKNFLGTGFSVWDIATFTAFISCYAKIADKSSKTAKLFNSIQKAKVSWLRLKPMLQDERVLLPQANIVENNNKSNINPVYMSINSLSFGYEKDKLLIKELSFNAHSGEVIGITGKVASGKSTLGKLLIGEYNYNGSIKINDIELNSMSKNDINALVTYLGHNSELFSYTIKENLLLGGSANVMPYLQTVELKDEVEESGGIDKSIGNLGAKLSGGQQKRLALARTLIYAKSILVLDDCFAAVDKKTEKAIFDKLKKDYSDRIIILISHRIKLFNYVDKVVFLGEKQNVISTHLELVKNNDEYYKLNKLQSEVDE